MQTTQLEVTAHAQPAQLQLRTVTLPAPRAGEVLLDMLASSVNPIDAKRSQGYGQRVLRWRGAGRLPLVMGNDVVGTVRSLGPGVRGFEPGDRVFGVKATGPSGTHAQHVLLPAKFLRQAPAGVPAPDLAVLPYTFTTLLQALTGAGLTATSSPGKAVLVLGAAGGLGQLAVQTLAAWGARVTAVCSAGDTERCLQWGATEAIDRRQSPLRNLQARFDATLNFASWDEDTTLASKLRPGALGHATTVHPLLGNLDRLGWLRGAWQTLADKRRGAAAVQRASPGAAYAWTVFRPDAAALDLLAAGLLQGRYRMPLGLVVPLALGAQAFAHIQNGQPGRAAILCGPTTDPIA